MTKHWSKPATDAQHAKTLLAGFAALNPGLTIYQTKISYLAATAHAVVIYEADSEEDFKPNEPQ